MTLMLIFPAAAAVTFGVLCWADLKRYAPFWGPAVALWALAIGREPSVIFLGLFLMPTIVLGIAVAFKRMAPMPFVLIALSDIALAVALSIFQSKTALWTLPEVGEWGSDGLAAGLAAGAAILRLGCAADTEDVREGGLLSIGWWQGAMLAYWVGSQAAVPLVVGGILLWGAAAYYSRSNLGALSLAGGVLAVAAGLGADLAGVVALGLAGTALIVGERVAATWLVAILPLSLLTLLDLPGEQLMALPALVFPGAWAAMSTRLSSIRPLPDGQPYVSFGAGLVAVGYTAAVISSFFTGAGELGEGGLPVEAINGIWLLYGAGLAAGVTLSVTGNPLTTQLDLAPPTPHSQLEILLPKLLPPVAWFSFFVAVVVAVRLLLAGFRTSFL